MLPSQLRLSRIKFKELLEKDHQVVFNRLGTLKYKENRPIFSVVTSSKHEKRAVLRNKARRRVYSLFQGEKPGIIAALYISKHAYTMTFDEIKNLFYDLLAKVKKNTK